MYIRISQNQIDKLKIETSNQERITTRVKFIIPLENLLSFSPPFKQPFKQRVASMADSIILPPLPPR